MAVLLQWIAPFEHRTLMQSASHSDATQPAANVEKAERAAVHIQ